MSHAPNPRTVSAAPRVCDAPAAHTRAKALPLYTPGTALLRAAMAATGTSQAALGEALGVSTSRAQAWCEGAPLSLDAVLRLATRAPALFRELVRRLGEEASAAPVSVRPELQGALVAAAGGDVAREVVHAVAGDGVVDADEARRVRVAVGVARRSLDVLERSLPGAK